MQAQINKAVDARTMKAVWLNSGGATSPVPPRTDNTLAPAGLSMIEERLAILLERAQRVNNQGDNAIVRLIGQPGELSEFDPQQTDGLKDVPIAQLPRLFALINRLDDEISRAERFHMTINGLF